MEKFLGLLFLIAFGVTFAGASVSFFHHRWSRAVVGDFLVVDRGPSRRLQLLVYLGLAALGCHRLSGLAADYGRGAFFLGAAISLLGALALVGLPRERDGWVGTRGVRQGWTVRPWGAVESWRMVGEHLRFRTDERWRAIPVPEADRADVRAALEAAAPDTESELA